MKVKLTREECADIKRLYADTSKRETSATLAHLFRVSPQTILAVLNDRYTPFEDRKKRAPRKTARKTVTSIELTCPTCEETIPAPGGSLFWTVAECGPQNADKCYCRHCNQLLKFPKGV